MNRITTLFALTLMVFGGLVIAAAPAAAGAEPFETERCFDYVLPYHEACEQASGVIVENESPSGDTVYVLNSNVCTQITRFDELVYEGCVTYHTTLLEKDGEPLVHQMRVSGENWSYESDGATRFCTHTFNIVYANGEVRHGDSQIECAPVS